MSMIIFQFGIHTEREFSRRIDIAHQYRSQCVTGFTTAIPTFDDGRDLVYPRHCHTVSRNQYDYRAGIGLRQSLDNSVLTIRKPIRCAISTFTILAAILIQTADKNDIIGRLRFIYSFIEQFIGRPRFSKIDFGNHPIIRSIDITDISTSIHHLSSISDSCLQSVQWGYLISCFQRRASATYRHHLYRILSDNQDAFGFAQTNG